MSNLRQKNNKEDRSHHQRHNWMNDGPCRKKCTACNLVRVQSMVGTGLDKKAVYTYSKYGVELAENPKCTIEYGSGK